MIPPGRHYTFLSTACELLKCSISDGEWPGNTSAESLFLDFYCCYLAISLAFIIESIYRKEQYNIVPLDIKIFYQENFESIITQTRYSLES
jgi:hypothetical protein